MKRIVLVGYYGCGNLGDEAILTALCRQWTRSYENLDLTIVASSAAGVSKHVLGFSRVRIIQNPNIPTSPRFAFGTVRTADLVVIGGGGLLTDLWTQTLLNFGWPAWVGKLTDVPVMGYGLGIGPLKTMLGRTLCRSILSSFDCMTVRDSDSLRLATKLTRSKVRAELGSDPVFLLDVPMERSGGSKRIDVRGAKVGVFPRFLPSQMLERQMGEKEVATAWISLLGDLGARYGMKPTVMVLNKMEDGEHCEFIARSARCDVSYVDDYQSLIRQIQGFDLCIGMRLHSLIFSLMCEKPFIAVSYLPKVRSFSEDAGMGNYCITLSDFVSARDSLSLIDDMLADMSELGSILREARIRAVRRALVSEKMVAEILFG